MTSRQNPWIYIYLHQVILRSPAQKTYCSKDKDRSHYQHTVKQQHLGISSAQKPKTLLRMPFHVCTHCLMTREPIIMANRSTAPRGTLKLSYHEYNSRHPLKHTPQKLCSSLLDNFLFPCPSLGGQGPPLTSTRPPFLPLPPFPTRFVKLAPSLFY